MPQVAESFLSNEMNSSSQLFGKLCEVFRKCNHLKGQGIFLKTFEVLPKLATLDFVSKCYYIFSTSWFMISVEGFL
ncbi:hypothetical protein ACZ11_09685 [Lysinibacillus xylanilyticus]|uniref:Uncharacterized protein n=1 Tax=Lysinibacillus xylanilyticus TaxID=582475 RepID=A0A0K9FD42_9BACI|nr:hypothetical protein ACZ11_09685 [Lysinibacillus xylanilyticus]